METLRKTHPMILAAAASVTALSLTGVAALMGYLPPSTNASHVSTAPLAAAAPAAETRQEAAKVASAQKSESPTTLTIPAGTRITVEPKAAPVRQARSETARPASTSGDGEHVRASTQRVSDNGIYVEQARPVQTQTAQQAQPQSLPSAPNAPNANSQPMQPYAQAPAACYDCGTVESVREVSNKGEGTGLGAVAGGVLGGLLGSQIGGGNGKKAMAVVGAAGGAFAGHEVEKRMRGETQYEIIVRFDDGRTRTYTETQATQLQSGDRVRLSNGRLTMI